MTTKEEVLAMIVEYRRNLGEDTVERINISNEWSDEMTLAVLLVKDPNDRWYQNQLDDEATREIVVQKLRSFFAGNLNFKNSMDKKGTKKRWGMATVVIPECTETCRKLWEATLKEGSKELQVFPGLFGIPRGIQGFLVEDLAFARDRPPGQITVHLSNGWTIDVPQEDVHVLSA